MRPFYCFLLVGYSDRNFHKFPGIDCSSPLDEANSDLALLLDPQLRGKDLSEVCADLRDASYPAGPSADVRTVTATFRQLQQTAEIANDRGRVLQFVATPGQGPRFPANRQSGLIKQALGSTRDEALNG